MKITGYFTQWQITLHNPFQTSVTFFLCVGNTDSLYKKIIFEFTNQSRPITDFYANLSAHNEFF